MSLAEQYPDEIKAIFAKYPEDRKRSAVMPLLYLAQREEGYVTKESMQEIASMLDIDTTEVASIVGFYTLYHDEKAGKYRMQVCNDLPCALRGADKFLDALCGNLGIKVGETTPDGLVTLVGFVAQTAAIGMALCKVESGIRSRVRQTTPPGPTGNPSASRARKCRRSSGDGLAVFLISRGWTRPSRRMSRSISRRSLSR